MSDQKVDTMAKARAAKKPPAYKNVHEDVKALPDDNYLSLKNVKEWEKHNKDRVKELKYLLRKNREKNKERNVMERELNNREGYLKNLATYLDTAVWLDLFYGQDQEHLMSWKTIAHAYDEDGYRKTQESLDFCEDVEYTG